MDIKGMDDGLTVIALQQKQQQGENGYLKLGKAVKAGKQVHANGCTKSATKFLRCDFVHGKRNKPACILMTHDKKHVIAIQNAHGNKRGSGTKNRKPKIVAIKNPFGDPEYINTHDENNKLHEKVKNCAFKKTQMKGNKSFKLNLLAKEGTGKYYLNFECNGSGNVSNICSDPATKREDACEFIFESID